MLFLYKYIQSKVIIYNFTLRLFSTYTKIQNRSESFTDSLLNFTIVLC